MLPEPLRNKLQGLICTNVREGKAQLPCALPLACLRKRVILPAVPSLQRQPHFTLLSSFTAWQSAHQYLCAERPPAPPGRTGARYNAAEHPEHEQQRLSQMAPLVIVQYAVGFVAMLLSASEQLPEKIPWHPALLKFLAVQPDLRSAHPRLGWLL